VDDHYPGSGSVADREHRTAEGDATVNLLDASDADANFSLHREHFNAPLVARFSIEGEPVSKARPRFTGRGSKTRAYTPEKTYEAEQRVAWKFRQAARGHTLNPDLTYGVVGVFFSGTRQRRDVDNMLKLLLDGLNKVAWPDDEQVVEISGRKEHCDPEDARTEVAIYVVGRVYRPTGACELCSKSFPLYRSQEKRRFCGQACHLKWREARRQRTCEHCGTAFDSASVASPAKFCSVDCKAAAGRASVTCFRCGIPFTKQRCHVRERNFCSVKCRAEAVREGRKPQSKGTCKSCGGPTSKKAYDRCGACSAGNAGQPILVDPIDSHCHVTRADGDEPCVLGAHDGDVHEDPDGTEYRTVPLTKEGGRHG
jgi:crossover junction endodeoxyribonuclease RusA